MNKLSKTAKILSLGLAILFWILLLQGLIYSFFSAQSCFALLKEPTQDVTITVHGITQNSLSIYSESGIEITRQNLVWENLLTLVVSCLQIPASCFGIHLLRKILAPMAQQRPFSGTSGLLKKLGWVSMVLAIIRNTFEYILVYLHENIMPVSELFQGSSITRVTFHFEPDITFIVVALVVFILATVFRYGEELQQLSDETL